MSVISYNSRVEDGKYFIEFESNDYEEFKKIEDEIRKLIDKRVTMKLLKEKVSENYVHDNPENSYK